MAKVRVTARQIAERLDISYVIASGLISYLEDVGKAVIVDKIVHPSGRGKPTRVYEVDSNVTIDFGEVAVVPKTEVVVAEDVVVTDTDVAEDVVVTDTDVAEDVVVTDEDVADPDLVAGDSDREKALARLRSAVEDAA